MRVIFATLSVCLILISVNCAPRYMSTGALGKYVYFPIDPRQLITVEDPTIRRTLNMITSDQTDFRSDFRKLQAWVSSHIVYSNDSYYHWQTPVETLEKRTGNCKDFAVLLCTLSRAAGVPAGDIYVAIGKDRSNNSHAFIIEKWILDRWQVVEPQVGGFIISDLTSIDTADRYTIYSRFNDEYYLGETAFITSSETFLTSVTPASAANKPAVAGSEPVEASPSPTVNPLPEIDYFYFKQVPNIVGSSNSTMLTWQVTGASLVYIDNGIGYVATSGSQIVTLPAGTVYTITARNENGEVKSMAFR
ncbi:MAG: transglutaminase domain-containing protein [Dehalococcoidia bacterium]|nr:transglutaminase domain-containing protein [Dehalococcoidia bacterium]